MLNLQSSFCFTTSGLLATGYLSETNVVGLTPSKTKICGVLSFSQPNHCFVHRNNVSPVPAVLLTGLIGCWQPFVQSKSIPSLLGHFVLGFVFAYLPLCLCMCEVRRWEVIVQTESIPSSQDNFHSHVQSARSPKSCTGQYSSKIHEQENSALI